MNLMMFLKIYMSTVHPNSLEEISIPVAIRTPSTKILVSKYFLSKRKQNSLETWLIPSTGRENTR